jgi:hypothetical protein
MGQVYQCWWRICREIIFFFFSSFEYHMYCDLFIDSPTYVYLYLITLLIPEAVWSVTWPNLNCYPVIFLQGLRKPQKFLKWLVSLPRFEPNTPISIIVWTNLLGNMNWKQWFLLGRSTMSILNWCPAFRRLFMPPWSWLFIVISAYSYRKLRSSGYHTLGFSWFSFVPLGKCLDSTTIRPWPLLSKFFLIRYSSIIILFGAI